MRSLIDDALAKGARRCSAAAKPTAVFSRDKAQAWRVAARIWHINGPTVHDESQMPFGGVKGGGIDRFGGKPASPSSPTCAG